MTIKKTYCFPEIIEIRLDRSLSLNMVSEYTPPDDPFGSAAAPAPPAAARETETSKSSFEENPFK